MARIPGLKVVQSKVAGYGVITTRKRKKGSVICNVEGVLWREGERSDDRYSLILEPGVFFDMVDQTRWVNHSCEPNVVVEAGVTALGNGWAQLQALRDLRPGEELFFDYALPEHLKERCFCGAKRCRGWIVEASAPVPPAPSAAPVLSPGRRLMVGRGKTKPTTRAPAPRRRVTRRSNGR